MSINKKRINEHLDMAVRDINEILQCIEDEYKEEIEYKNTENTFDYNMYKSFVTGILDILKDKINEIHSEYWDGSDDGIIKSKYNFHVYFNDS